MSTKTSKTIMKCMAGTLAICSAMAMAGGMMANSSSTGTKKLMKKTVNKMAEIVDTVSSFM